MNLPNIELPMWLCIIIGIIFCLNAILNLLNLNIVKKYLFKLLILIFYKNNIELYRAKKTAKKAKDKLTAEQVIKKQQKKNLKKRLNR